MTTEPQISTILIKKPVDREEEELLANARFSSEISRARHDFNHVVTSLKKSPNTATYARLQVAKTEIISSDLLNPGVQPEIDASLGSHDISNLKNAENESSVSKYIIVFKL